MSTPIEFTPPAPEEFNRLIGDGYEVESLFAVGGMGAVYKARQPRLDRFVAIKVLPPIEDDGDMNYVERFQREAQMMARLDHPHIMHVYDFGETPPQTEGGKDQLFYFVMEFIDGTDLQQMIAAGQLTTNHVYGWLPQICDALQYAHEQGVVHRDIKPANVMVTADGRIKMADFGLAKLSDTNLADAVSLTRADVAMGTPDYVAPEVLIDGEKTDHRVDLYSLGVMLYAVLTGEVPRGAWEPPSEKVPGLDSRFDDVVELAMQRSPEKRYQSAGEISTAISKIAAGPAEMRPRLVTGPVNPGEATAQPRLVTGPVNPADATGQTAPVKMDSLTEQVKARAAERRLQQEAAAKAARAKARKRNLIIGGVGLAAAVPIALFMTFGPGRDGNTTKAPAKPQPDSITADATPPQPDSAPRPEPEPQPEPAPNPAADKDPTLLASSDMGDKDAPAATASTVGENGSDGDAPAVEPQADGEGSTETAAVEDIDNPAALAEVQQRIEALADLYQQRRESEALAAYDAGFEKLKTGFVGALQRAARGAANNAQVQGAFRNEIARINAGEPIPTDDASNVPQSLKALRKTWHAEKARLDRARGIAERPILEAYLEEIETYANELVAEGKVKATAPIKEVRLRLEEELAALPPVDLATPAAESAEPDSGKPQGNPTVPVLTSISQYPFPPQRQDRIGVVRAWTSGRGEQRRVTQALPEVVEVEAHSTAWGVVFADGTAKLFGTETHPAVKDQPPLSQVVSLAIGHHHAVALLEGGTVQAWGNGDKGETAVPERINDFVWIDALGAATLALRSTGEAVVWGPSSLLSQVNGKKQIARIAAGGGDYAILLSRTGRIEIIDINRRIPTDRRREIERLKDVVAIDCTSTASLALQADGSVHAWGWRSIGGEKSSFDPLPKDLPRDIDQVRVGGTEWMRRGAVGMVHSRSQGWIFFGEVVEKSKLETSAKGVYQIAFSGDMSYGLAPPPKQTAEDPSTTTHDLTRGRTIRVSPEGLGDTLTLDDALEQVAEGETLWLAPGTYPPSASPDRPGITKAGNYAVLKPNVTIRGHRSIIPKPIRIPTPDVTIMGIRVPSVDVPGSANFTLLNSIVGTFSADSCSAPRAENCFVGVISAGAQRQEFNHVTVYGGKQGRVHRGEILFENSVLSGGAAYLFSFDRPATKKFEIVNSVVAPKVAFASVKKSGEPTPAHVEKPDEFAPNGIDVVDCVFEKPVFVDQENAVFSLSPQSPGKGNGPDGRDLGANVDETGWPVPIGE